MPAPATDTFFLSYQTRWIKDNARLKLMEKARQIGLSWGTAYSDARACSLVRQDIWVTSRDELQAQLYLQDCLHWAKILHSAATLLGQQVIDDKKKAKAYVMEFANGSHIYSMSSNADAQVGKRGSRRLDEYAVHPDQRKLWSIAYPGITWGGNLAVISTHRGSQSHFNQLVLEAREGGNPKHISLHRVTLQDALDQGFLQKLKAKLPPDDERQEMDEAAYFDFIRSGCADEESFLQEYMCVPADDATAFITYALLDGCTMSPAEEWETQLDPTGEYFMGVDIGRNHDLTVLFLVERCGEVLITRRMIELKGCPFAEQARVIDEYAALPWVRRVCMDATGIGMQLAEERKAKHGAKVEAVNFTNGVKEDLATTLKRAMEDRALRIPHNPQLSADMRSIRKQTTSAGNVRFAGERNSNGHADRFWACALALHAAAGAGGGGSFAVWRSTGSPVQLHPRKHSILGRSATQWPRFRF